MANISIVSAPEWAYAGDVITVRVSWESDISAYAFVGLYPSGDSFGFGEFMEAGVYTEDIKFLIEPESTDNEIWAVLSDGEGNALTEWVGPVPIDIMEPDVPPNAPTDAPLLIAPADNADTDKPSPEFSWEAVTGASTYAYIVRDINKVWIQNFTTLLKFTPATSLPNGQYFWKVQATNSYGAGPWSKERTLNIGAPTLQAPTLVSPANNSNLTTDTPKLDWSDVLYAYKYHLQVATDFDFKNLWRNQADLKDSEDRPSLVEGSYFWRVRTKDINLNYGPWSSVWKFWIITPAPPTGVPSKPTLVSPAIDATIRGVPTFKWNRTPTATLYRLEVSNNVKFTNKYVEVETSTTEYTPTDITLPLGKIYWAVRAKNNVGWSKWSDTWNFILALPAPTPTPKKKAGWPVLVGLAGLAGLLLALLTKKGR